MGLALIFMIFRPPQGVYSHGYSIRSYKGIARAMFCPLTSIWTPIDDRELSSMIGGPCFKVIGALDIYIMVNVVRNATDQSGLIQAKESLPASLALLTPYKA